MNDYQYLRRTPTLTSILLLLCVVVCVALVLGFVLTAEGMQKPARQSTTGEAMQPLSKSLESADTAEAPGLKIMKTSGEEPEADGSEAQLLLEHQEEMSLAGEHSTCPETKGDEACGAPFLELIPPESANATNGKTLLLLGVDSRTGGLISLTDTIMLLFLDEATQNISLLSIPRDLYVSIPGYGRDRINTAVVHGAEGDDLETGIALLEQTIEQTFRVGIDHYILVDFRAVVRSIDALGGINVYVPYDIHDPTFPDMKGGFDPLFIPEGEHHFAGEMALKYARTRHQDNDFYRAQRQQQVLLAIRRQVFNLGVSDLLESAPALYQQVRHGVFTDLNVMELVQLGQAMSEIPLDNIHTAVLDDEYVSNIWTEAGESVLILKPSAASSLIEEIFTN